MLANKLRAINGLNPQHTVKSQYSRDAFAKTSTSRFIKHNEFTKNEKLTELQIYNLQQMKRITQL